MTSYSFNEQYFDEGYISTEIKTVNHKYLEVNVSLPYYLQSMDIKIRELIQSKLKRGKIDVSVSLKLNEASHEVDVDLSLAGKYIEGLRKIVETYNLKDEVKLFHLTRFDDIIKLDKKRDYDRYFDKICESLLINLSNVNKMRYNEGEATKKNIINICNNICNNICSIEFHVPIMEKQIFDTIKSKVVELIGDKVDETRLLNEVALMVTRSCINEEIERLKMHSKEFLELCNESDDVGKRLDFICQEMNREINTIGSKVTLKELSNIVIAVKNDIEKLREQIRNIE